MGTVILHAGMGKAGSSSIRAWLAGELPTLRERGIELLTARREPEDHRFVRLLPYRRGRIHANRLVVHYEVEGADRRALMANFVEQLAAHAARWPVTVITVEAAELLFWRGDAELVDALNDLGREHTVRVAYYVRPQHTALEAYWRQWGFRSGQRPSQALRERADALDYLSTYDSMTARAEGFSFEVRPFREDLLVGGNPVTDFAQTFFGLASGDLPEHAPWSNRGLPIEVVNALAQAPEGLFWSSLHDNERLDRVKEVLGEIDAPDGPPAVAARRILQAYCRRRFEPGNARLIEALGWETDALVPPSRVTSPTRNRGSSPSTSCGGPGRRPPSWKRSTRRWRRPSSDPSRSR